MTALLNGNILVYRQYSHIHYFPSKEKLYVPIAYKEQEIKTTESSLLHTESEEEIPLNKYDSGRITERKPDGRGFDSR
jgi:hypothetical protein